MELRFAFDTVYYQVNMHSEGLRYLVLCAAVARSTCEPALQSDL